MPPRLGEIECSYSTIVGRRAAMRHVRNGSRLCEKSVVQFARRTFVSISSIPKTIALGTSVKSRQLRKQFCAPLARATFHTAWVKNGSVRARAARPFYPQEQTSSACPSMSVWCCHERTCIGHSITSSARRRSDGGTVNPRALAVLRLIASWYFVGACTGKLASLSPLKMRST
jgi:hypothetical protein